MNAPRCAADDYINFLVASLRAVRGTEAARAQPERASAPAPDAFTRLLHRLEPEAAASWAEATPLIACDGRMLVLDDSTLDKSYARTMDPVTRHWSGKNRRVVSGINQLTLLWPDGEALIPCKLPVLAV